MAAAESTNDPTKNTTWQVDMSIDKNNSKESNKMSDKEMEQKRQELNAQRDLKRQQMIDAMAKRRKNRSNGRDIDNAQTKEQIDEFLESFHKEFDSIEDNINECKDYESFKNLQLQRHGLEEKLAEAARFLPNYTYEARVKQLSKLKQDIQNAQKKTAPKPKFKFSNENQKHVINSNMKRNKNNNDENDKSVINTNMINDKNENENKNKNENESDSKIEEFNKLLSNDNEIKIENKKLATIMLDKNSLEMDDGSSASDVCLSNLTNCQISIVEHISALRMNNIKNCTIITGPISGSLHVEYIENSKVHAAMRQCRIHNATKTCFYIHVNSEPVIEHSEEVMFAPYNVEYNDLNKQWSQCDVDKKVNKWDQVKDFNWFKQTQSPHWSIIREENRIGTVRPVEDEDEDEL